MALNRNVEIKAKVRDPERFRALAVAVADTGPELIEQTDTFFEAVAGRLKLRQFADGTGELICYSRPDASGPKTSQYGLAPMTDSQRMLTVLSTALTVRGTVAKKRWLYLAGRTRIHLDHVENLGWYMELEVVLSADEDLADGEQEARQLMARLDIGETDLCQSAYIDLMS